MTSAIFPACFSSRELKMSLFEKECRYYPKAGYTSLADKVEVCSPVEKVKETVEPKPAFEYIFEVACSEETF